MSPSSLPPLSVIVIKGILYMFFTGNYSAQTRNVHILALLGEKSLQNAHVLTCTLRFLIDFSPKIIQNLNVLRVLDFAVNSYGNTCARIIRKPRGNRFAL